MSKLRKPAKFPWKNFRRFLAILFLCAVGAGLWVAKTPIMAAAEDIMAQALDARVKRILVEGALYTDPNDLKQAIQLKDGDPLMGFAAPAARERLEALPWIKTAAVNRRLPSTIQVDIFEHIPLARVQTPDGIFVTNKEGTLIAPTDERFTALPLLKGEGAPIAAAKLFAQLIQHPNLLSHLHTAEHIGKRRWNLLLKGGVLIKLPEGENETIHSLTLLQQLDAQRHIFSLTKGMVDLRLTDRIVLDLPEGAAADDLVL